MITKSSSQAGQAVVTLLFLAAISIVVITSVVLVVFNNTLASSNFEQGTVAYYYAESGIENALVRLLRDPNYSGESIDLEGGSVVTQVSGGTITSTATVANSVRKIQVETLYNNTVLTITSWKEIN